MEKRLVAWTLLSILSFKIFLEFDFATIKALITIKVPLALVIEPKEQKWFFW